MTTTNVKATVEVHYEGNFVRISNTVTGSGLRMDRYLWSSLMDVLRTPEPGRLPAIRPPFPRSQEETG